MTGNFRKIKANKTEMQQVILNLFKNSLGLSVSYGIIKKYNGTQSLKNNTTGLARGKLLCIRRKAVNPSILSVFFLMVRMYPSYMF